MTTNGANVTAADVLLASAAVVLIGSSAWLIVASRHSSAMRLFGQVVPHPRLVAAGFMCMGLYVLLGLADLTEVTPATWRTASRWISTALFLVAWTSLVIYWIRRYRARTSAPSTGEAPARPE